MITKEKVTLDEWSQLYNAAIAFKKAKCWEWMNNEDIFGVKDPESGEIGYCCIMGQAGEHFALAAYLGSEGLDVLLRLLSDDVNVEEDPENLFIQKCLMCSFEDRNYLAKEDLKIIKELGLKFRGRNEWPLFRHYEPGLYPWFLDAKQCRFLTHILKQALDVSSRCKKDKKILKHKNPYTFLVRVPVSDGNGKLIWEDQYLAAEPPKQELTSFKLVDEIQIRKLKKMKSKNEIILEADTFYTPIIIRGKERPYYPKACLFLDHGTGMVISFELLRNIQKESIKCVELLLNYIENYGLPTKILVSRKETYHLFSTVCQQLGIELEFTDFLEFMEEARYSLFEMLSR